MPSPAGNRSVSLVELLRIGPIALALSCGGAQDDAVERPRVSNQENVVDVWHEPYIEYVSVPPLLSSDGAVMFDVVDEGEDNLLEQRGAYLFSLPDSTWALHRDGLYQLGEEPLSVEHRRARLPLSGYSSGSSDTARRLATDLPRMFFSAGSELFSIVLEEDGGRISGRTELEGPALGLYAHPQGLLVVERHSNRLALLEPTGLATQWALYGYCCVPLALLDRRVYGIRRDDELRYFLTEIDTTNGEVLRELQITGEPVAPMVQSGRTLWGIFDDGTGRIGESTSRLFLETIDLDRLEHQVVDLQANKDGFGAIYSSMLVLVDSSDAFAGVAIAVNGEPGRLRVVRDNSLSEVTFPETNEAEGYRKLAQLGPQVALAVEHRLHLFLLPDLSYKGALLFPDDIDSVRVVGNDLLIETDELIYRLRPGGSAERAGVEPAYVRIEPFRFGQPDLLRDGDPETPWRFVGATAEIDVVFERPVVVPQIRLHGASSSDGSGTGASARISYHARELDPSTRRGRSVSFEGDGPHDLIDGINIARRVSVAITCNCPESSPRCTSCTLGELEIDTPRP